MTREDRITRRSKIIRRWTAYRVSRAQRAIWKKRRARAGRTLEDNAGMDVDLLAELPDSLLG